MLYNRDYNMFDLDLALNILKEERLADAITLMELKKQQNINSIEDLFAALKRYDIMPDDELQIDVKQIYDIIYRENIVAGDYRMVKFCTPSKIRSLIGRWNPPSVGQMKIGAVVDDIYSRVMAYTQGECYYYNGKQKNALAKGKYVYKLIICKKIAIFVDLNRRISYHILRK